MDFVYLDYNATTPIDEQVQGEMIEAMKYGWGYNSVLRLL